MTMGLLLCQPMRSWKKNSYILSTVCLLGLFVACSPQQELRNIVAEMQRDLPVAAGDFTIDTVAYDTQRNRVTVSIMAPTEWIFVHIVGDPEAAQKQAQRFADTDFGHAMRRAASQMEVTYRDPSGTTVFRLSYQYNKE